MERKERMKMIHPFRIAAFLSACVIYVCVMYACVICTVATAQQDVTPSIQLPSPPFAFTREHIRAAGMQAKRAGWTADTLAVQLRQSLEDYQARPVRLDTVVAVLLGGDERIQQALVESRKAFSVDPASQTPHDWFQTLQSYDCLLALAEVGLSNPPDKLEADQKLAEYAAGLFAILPESFTRKEQALHQAACLYASLLTGDEAQVQSWLQGDDYIPPLWKTLSEAVANEGYVVEAPAYIGYLYTVLSALRYFSEEDFQSLRPWVERHLDFCCAVLNSEPYPPVTALGNEAGVYWLLSALERSAERFNHVPSQHLLQRWYENTYRRADMLLFGPVQWDTSKRSDPMVYPSAAYPRIGMVFLQDGEATPIRYWMNLGLESKSQSGLLGLHSLLFPLKKRWGYLGFNTVLIDHQWESMNPEDSAQNALLTDFVPFTDGGTFVSARASGRYGERANYANDHPNISPPVSRYQRDVYVYAPYVIDWFRVTGGKTHDYTYQLAGRISSHFGMENVKSISSNPANDLLSDYPNLSDAESVQSAQAQGVYGLEATPYNHNRDYQRITLIDPMGSTLFQVDAEQYSFLIHRREFNEPTANLFAAIHDYGTQAHKAELQIQLPALSPQANAGGFEAMAFVIQNGTQEDLFYSSIQPDQLYTTTYHGEDIEFKAKFAHIQWMDGALKMMRFIGGTRLHVGGHQLQTETALTTGVIHSLDEKNGSFGVTLPHGVPIGDTLAGHVLHVIASEPDVPFMQPLPIARIDRQQNQPRYYLSNRINLSSPPKRLAAPIQNGDQVLYESFAQLRHLQGDRYRIRLSSPLTVGIPAVENRKRLFIDENYVRRLQGELQDGMIQVQLKPENSSDGTIEVVRVP